MRRLIVHLIYETVKLTAKISILVYYHPIVVIDREKHFVNNPAIMISNHPNTLVDPFQTGVWIKRQIYFLANSGMFASYLGNLFFSNVHCIPIQRKSDQHAVNNTQSFKRVNEFLSSGGLLWVAMEGGSEQMKRLRPLKSGTARIAFSAETANNWQLNLVILPTGLTYEQPDHFRTQATTLYGAPVQVSDYRADYERDPSAAVRRLTNDLRQRMLALIVHTEDAEQETLLTRIETLYRSENPLSGAASFYRSQKLSKELQLIKQQEPSRYAQLVHQLSSYFDDLEQLKTNDRAVVETRANYTYWRSILLLIIGLPVFLYGILNNLFSAGIPLLLEKKLQVDPSYRATVKIVGGIVTFAIFWLIQTVLVYHFSQDGWLTLAYLVTLYPLSILAWEYYVLLRQLIKNWQFRHRPANEREKILANREDIWQQVKTLL